MKTLFDATTRNEVIKRINTLNPDCSAQWGKMNVYQMTKHCTIWDKWVLGLGDHNYKQGFIGLLFGKMSLKGAVKDEKPLPKNAPAGKEFTVKEKDGDLQLQKELWIDLIRQYENYSNPDFIHDFYGKMTGDQIGIFAYKHSDHHLRQFGV